MLADNSFVLVGTLLELVELSSDLHSGDKSCTDILSRVFLTINRISPSLSKIIKHAAATKKTEVSS
jgi:hypothetical protein